MELQKHYKDDNFRYSCPECREGCKKKKRDKKELNKRNTSCKAEGKSIHKRRCTENNSSVYSNSAENEASKPQKSEFVADGNMAIENSQLDEEMVEDSYYSQTDNGKKVALEIDPNGTVQESVDSRKETSKKRKQVKKSKSGSFKAKKMIKRTVEDNSSNDYQRYHEPIEEFTKERSIKIVKERQDIVESRSL
jgi:hypothetical protein